VVTHKVCQVSDKAMGTAEAITGLMSSVDNALSTTTGSATGLLDTLTGAITGLKDFFGKFWVVPAVLLCYAIFNSYGGIGLVTTTILCFAAKLFGDFWPHISGYFSSDTIESQSGGIDLASFVASVTACFFVPGKDSKTMVGEITRRIGSVERTANGFSYIMERGLKYFEAAVNAVLSLCSETRVSWTSQTDRLLSQWAAKVDAFELKSIQENPSLDDLNDAMKLMQEGVGFRQTLKVGYNVNFLNKYMDRLSGAITAHRGALAQATSFRMQPISIMLGGGSGVGKTTVLKWLASAIMLMTKAVKPDQVLNNMWQKGISEYWNGYVQQFVYIMDDCFQQKTDGKQMDNEAMFMIRAVGNWAFPLNFADIDSKGRFYFMSNIIMGSTNVADIHSHCSNLVAEPMAVTRRIQHGYWTFVAPEFQVGGDTPRASMLDYAKVSRYIKEKRQSLGETYTVDQLLDCIPWHAWRLVPHRFEGTAPSSVESSFTLLDLAKQVSSEYTERKAAHDDEVTELSAWANDLAKGLIESQAGVTSHRYDVADSLALEDFDDDELCNIADVGGRFSYALPEEVDELADYPEPSNEPALKRKKMYARKRAAERARSVRVCEAQHRRDWVGCALTKLVELCELNGLPPFMSAALRFIRDVDPTPEALFDQDTWFEDMPVFSNVLVNAMRLIKTGGALLLIRNVVKMAISLVSWLTDLVTRVFGRAQPQSNTQDVLSSKAKSIRFPRIQAEPQLGNPPKDVQGEIAFNNTYKMVVLEEHGIKTLGQVLFIEGDLAVVPAHFRRELEASGSHITNPTIRFISCHKASFTVDIPAKAFLDLQHIVIPGCDLDFVKFDRRMLKAHRSIAHLFLTESALKQFFRNKNNTVRLDVARLGVEKPADMSSDAAIRRYTFLSAGCEYMHEGITVSGIGKVECAARYTAPTVAGDCGAPLSIAEPRFYGGASLIGIHVAGKVGLMSRAGYAAVITRELVYEARTHLGAWADNFLADMADRGIGVTELSPAEEDSLAQCGLLAGSFLPIGKVDKPIHMAGDSKIKVSPIGEECLWGPPPSRPAELRPVFRDGKRIEPMAKAMEAYQTPLEVRTVPNMEAIVEMAMKPHWEATMGCCRDILTFEEAVSPPEAFKLKPLNRKTSAGYPYRLAGTVGKTDFFGKDGEFLFDSPACKDLRLDVGLMLDRAKLNERSSVVFTDFLKDELRPHAKVDAVASRAISGAPLDYVIAVRMYFGAFLAANFRTHTISGMAPGINPYVDWHELADRLTSKGGKVFGGDFSRFDASEQPYVFEHILAYINRWYKFNNPSWKPEDDVVRGVLWLDLIHSRHLTGVGGVLDTLIQWVKSLPSGHPLTTAVNSMYALICLTGCYAHLTKDYRDMWTHVYMCTFGDDNISGVSDTVSEVFNQVTVAGAMKELFGLTYTSDKKGEELVPYESIDKVTFLKRTFKQDSDGSGGWVAPLDPNSFLYVPYWFKNPRDVAGDLYNNIEQMQGELCLHEPEMWDRYHALLQDFSAREGIALPFQTREAARQWVLSRSDAWY
jgi:hypothetical protein